MRKLIVGIALTRARRVRGRVQGGGHTVCAERLVLRQRSVQRQRLLRERAGHAARRSRQRAADRSTAPGVRRSRPTDYRRHRALDAHPAEVLDVPGVLGLAERDPVPAVRRRLRLHRLAAPRTRAGSCTCRRPARTVTPGRVAEVGHDGRRCRVVLVGQRRLRRSARSSAACTAGQPAVQPDHVLHVGDGAWPTTRTRASVRRSPAFRVCSSSEPVVRSPADSSARPTT